MLSPIDRAISAVQERRQAFALEALSNPPGRDAFGYGSVCGINKGLLMAEEIILKSKTEAEGGEL
jgi:hypothetical protein